MIYRIALRETGRNDNSTLHGRLIWYNEWNIKLVLLHDNPHNKVVNFIL